MSTPLAPILTFVALSASRGAPIPGIADDSRGESLLARAVDGDRDAFSTLFTTHAPALRAFLISLGNTPHIADDLVQDSFLRVWETRGRFQNGRAFRPWLFTIARNLSHNAHRESLPRQGELSLDVAESVASGGAVSPDTELGDALASLSTVARLSLTLSVCDGFSFREIAGILGITELAARAHASRARKSLRKRLGTPDGGRNHDL